MLFHESGSEQYSHIFFSRENSLVKVKHLQTMDKFMHKDSSGTASIDTSPLAAMMRPSSLDDYVGQKDVVGVGSPLYRLIESDSIPSLIFWGPPGSGKTTLAYIIANQTHKHFVKMSAVTSGVPEMKELLRQAEVRLKTRKQTTILFLDEIHRFNKLQQDVFLPYIEPGLITLIGATTENPSLSLNNALLSRCQVFRLHAIDADDMTRVLERGIERLGKVQLISNPESAKPYSTKMKIEEVEEQLKTREVIGKEIDGEDKTTEPICVACPQCMRVSFSVEPGVLAEIEGRSRGDCRTALGHLEMLAKARCIDHTRRVEALWRQGGIRDESVGERFSAVAKLKRQTTRDTEKRENITGPIPNEKGIQSPVQTPKKEDPFLRFRSPTSASSSKSIAGDRKMLSPGPARTKATDSAAKMLGSPRMGVGMGGVRAVRTRDVEQFVEMGFLEKKVRAVLSRMGADEALSVLLAEAAEEEEKGEKEEQVEENEEDPQHLSSPLHQTPSDPSASPTSDLSSGVNVRNNGEWEEGAKEEESGMMKDEDEAELDESLISTNLPCPSPYHPTLTLTLSHCQALFSSSPLPIVVDKSAAVRLDYLSALSSAIIGRDENAALYYTERLLADKEAPRRVMAHLLALSNRLVGLADPQAVVYGMASYQCYEILGFPEGNLNISSFAIYLCRAPHSSEFADAYDRCVEFCRTNKPEPIPLHVRNAPTKLMKQEGYAEGYIYTPRATAEENAKQTFLPQAYIDRGVHFFERDENPVE
ncbi:putative Replication-associated recombination protein A [Blattamonas nauphoetae]|uniref:Replication-associated recombination protein A n=1 Tax=Blattamonas nauphoetae TaxID=2049346 RepID=A0ABQ9XMG0_9EUKA|nr:putative Replication-associated recombination protein A [Blattamonas nauphoetae]